ncbi:VacJ family lipoprotein [Janthinobacterium sp.]|uniref:MlaA family lipoprotein n=1 Tax=Janthinobacterium sp. TaxID=1871054 RepID=UPI00293D8B3D|nr:VacJ family lipoprotein [Janthinobacterium sp.]
MKHATSPSPSTLRRLGLALAATAALSGCASTGNPRDPLEGFNRAMFKFNDTVDQAALKPAATVYKAVLPSFVQTGVGNFFGNLADVWNSANNLLQGKGEAGMSDFGRVVINSSFGILGLFDVASQAGLPKHSEDFGQTLGIWGVKSGPYLMLPLLGPSTMRDTVALPLDIAADPWSHKEPVYLRNIGTAVRVVDKRAYLLDASDLMEEAALDRYEFVRDSYLQQRESKVFDGEGNPRKLKAEPKDAAAESEAAPAVATDTAPAVAAETGAPVSSGAPVQELTTDTVAARGAAQ